MFIFFFIQVINILNYGRINTIGHVQPLYYLFVLGKKNIISGLPTSIQFWLLYYIVEVSLRFSFLIDPNDLETLIMEFRACI